MHYAFRLHPPPAMEYAALSGTCLLPGSGPLIRGSDRGELKYEFDGRHGGEANGGEAKQISLIPSEGKGVEKVWEITSRVSAESGMVSLMTQQHSKYEAVKRQFLEAWRHPGKQKPTIMRIYQVILQPVGEARCFDLTVRMQVRNTPSVYRAYLDYRDGLEKECDFKGQVTTFCTITFRIAA